MGSSSTGDGGACDASTARIYISEDAGKELHGGDSNGGKKWDHGKLRVDLIPRDALWVLSRVYSMGAEKYTDRNWEKGISNSRLFASLERHLWAWWMGENVDAESSLPHLAHVAWNALALLSNEIRGLGDDDRPPHG